MEFRLVLLLLLGSRSLGLRLVRLIVPPQADIGSTVTLQCDYDLEGESLYSVKWYKDDQEFFRYMPNSPHCLAFSVAGFAVDTSTCDIHSVSLVNLDLNSTGNYRCEVSSEAPNFEVVADSSNMTVMAFPVEDPVIEGIEATYSIGDSVSANCTSPRSRPLPTTMEWHINNVKVTSSIWEFPSDSNMIGLQFQVSRSHFKGHVPTMEIRCTARLDHMTRETTVSAALAQLTDQE